MTMTSPEARYYVNKVVHGVSDHQSAFDNPEYALGNLNYIELQLAELVENIRETEPKSQWNDIDEWLGDEFEPIMLSINHLRMFLQSAQPTKDNCLTAQVFAKFLESEVPQFVENYRPASSS